jgi:hypothetical protein
MLYAHSYLFTVVLSNKLLKIWMVNGSKKMVCALLGRLLFEIREKAVFFNEEIVGSARSKTPNEKMQ